MTATDATTRLMQAIERDDAQAVNQAIVAGAEINAKDRLGRTPVIIATLQDAVHAVTALLEAGADPNVLDEQYGAALHYAGSRGYVAVLQALITYGADVLSLNSYGGTALIPTSERGHVDAVKVLLETAVPVNHINNLGWTALHEAIVLGDGGPNHIETVRLLIAGGADVSIRDRNGVLPRDLAHERGFTQMVQLIEVADSISNDAE